MVVSSIASGLSILDLGSGGRRFRIRASVDPVSGTARKCGRVWSVDIDRSLDVDIVADAEALPFPDECFDLIISTAVLEHVENFAAAVDEIKRCCKTGGKVYIETPFLQTYHAHPHDYRRFTLPGLQALFKQWRTIDSGVCVGPFSTLAWYLRKMPRFLLGENLFGYAAEGISGWLTFWIKYLDRLVPSARRVHQAASGVYYLGEKR